MPETITGVLIADPEIRYTPHGQAITTLSFAEDGGPNRVVECVGELAENVALSLTVDHRVVIVGEPGVFQATHVAADLRQSTVEITRTARRTAPIEFQRLDEEAAIELRGRAAQLDADGLPEEL